MKNSALVVFSGGQDSTTCLGWALNRYEKVETITFNYFQKHSIEIKQAKLIAQKFGVKNFLFTMDIFAQLADSALLEINKDQDINSNHSSKKKLPASFVPNRNAIFFTIAHAYAQKQNLSHIITGINQTDYSGYPDCRLPFVKSLQEALNIGSESNIEFLYPLIDKSKAETFKMAEEEGVLDIVINMTHTCYNGDRNHFHSWGYGCNNCPACYLRKKGWTEYLKDYKKDNE